MNMRFIVKFAWLTAIFPVMLNISIDSLIAQNREFSNSAELDESSAETNILVNPTPSQLAFPVLANGSIDWGMVAAKQCLNTGSSSLSLTDSQRRMLTLLLAAHQETLRGDKDFKDYFRQIRRTSNEPTDLDKREVVNKRIDTYVRNVAIQIQNSLDTNQIATFKTLGVYELFCVEDRLLEIELRMIFNEADLAISPRKFEVLSQAFKKRRAELIKEFAKINFDAWHELLLSLTETQRLEIVTVLGIHPIWKFVK
jgi:hypothetical protein